MRSISVANHPVHVFVSCVKDCVLIGITCMHWRTKLSIFAGEFQGLLSYQDLAVDPIQRESFLSIALLPRRHMPDRNCPSVD